MGKMTPLLHLSGHTSLSNMKLKRVAMAVTTVFPCPSLPLPTASAACLMMSVRTPSTPGALPSFSSRMALQTSGSVMGLSKWSWCCSVPRRRRSFSSTSVLWSSS